MRILVTAIGSMSAECVIKQLKLDGHFVVGCDIYPGEWHYETKLCHEFIQAPFATSENEYVNFLVDTCKKYNLNFVVPLTDLEIDVINQQRALFDSANIVLCMQSSDVLSIARNKYKLHSFFEHDPNVPSVKTHLLTEIPSNFRFPCIAKPFNGRSSEGLVRNATHEQVLAIENKNNYIVQEQLDGDVFTVDYCRCAKSNIDCSIPRRELLRTKNGAGLTVKTVSNSTLNHLVSYIGTKLNINGCVNMEFIQNDGSYYLIDVNPRFSAGIAFSVLSGYNMVANHLSCFLGQDIEGQIEIAEKIMIKKYEEIIV